MSVMKPVKGVYLGWISPKSNKWEPMYRTICCKGGYKSEYTKLYDRIIDLYPGLELPLMFHPNPLKLPFALETRTPLSRLDYMQDARFLNLPYPGLDIFEFIGRTGGLMAGDPFSTCPIVELNENGTYTYESVMWTVDADTKDSIDESTQLKVLTHMDKLMLVTTDERPLGELAPYFMYLGSTITNVKIVRIAEEYFMGGQILVSFETSVNLSANSDFALKIDEKIGA
jgi:hypothetical protein